MFMLDEQAAWAVKSFSFAKNPYYNLRGCVKCGARCPIIRDVA